MIRYDPAELVVTVRAGTRVADLEEVLAAEHQMLGFEPPQFSAATTIGGAVAAGLAGPRRPFAGAVRDFVLGVKILNGNGERMSFGGEVMKNVAGFDIARLMAGALGTLGVLLEISLRVVPQPQKEKTLVLAHANLDDALALLNQLAGRPLPLSAAVWQDGETRIRLSARRRRGEKRGGRHRRRGGFPRCVSSGNSCETINCHFSVTSGRCCACHYRPPPTCRRRPAWRNWWTGAARNAGLPGKRMPTPCARRWPGTAVTLPAFGMPLATPVDNDARQEIFQPLAPALHALHLRLKRAFDPGGILNPGRLYRDF